jgi:DNA-directed RNA polymerase III subunit RPC1
MVNPQLSYLAKKALHGKILKKAKNNTKCLNFFRVNGPVKKCAGLMKILHEPYRGKKLTDPLVSNALDGIAASASNNKELIQCINPSSLSEELNPLQLLDMFKMVR